MAASEGEAPIFTSSRCFFNTNCGVCSFMPLTEPTESCESISVIQEFSGFARYLGGPIDDHDPDAPIILERKFTDLYRAQMKYVKSTGSIERHDINFKRPTYLPPHSLELIVWIDFPKPTTEKLMGMETFLEIKEYIFEIFELGSLQDALKAHIVSDLYAYAVQFARINVFNLQQMSTFLGIIKRVHEKNIGTPYTNADHCFDYCKELILLHSVHRPPFWTDIFTKDIAEIIIQYMVATYFKHFRLYKNAFTHYIVLDVDIEYPNATTDHQPGAINSVSVTSPRGGYPNGVLYDINSTSTL